MLPNNYMVSGQQGIPQPQSQPGLQPSMHNIDPARMWQLHQQQQQQQQQHQQQQQAQQQLAALRSQGNGVTQQQQQQQQMLDFLRSRGLPTQQQGMPQQQQQQQQQHHHLPFGGMPQVGASVPPSFPHDPSQGLQGATSQFGNSPGGQNFANSMQLARGSNQMFPPSAEPFRQLGLMLAQNQHTQKPMPAKQPQPPYHQPPGFFTGPINSSLPAGFTPTNVRPGMSQPNMHDGSHPQTGLKNMLGRAHALRVSISDGENRIKGLQSQHGAGPIPPDTIAEISKTQQELEMRRHALGRIMQMVQNFAQNSNGGGIPLPVNLNPSAASPIPNTRLTGGPASQSQVAWMPQPGPSISPAHQFNSPRPPMAVANMNSHAHIQPPVPPMSTPQLPAQMAASQSNQLGQRTTPQMQSVGATQHGPPQPPHGAVQNVLANNGMNMQHARQGPPPLFPLNPLLFQRAFYEQWLPKQAPKDKSILKFDGREIDLHQLHCEVMRAGTYRNVNQKDLWPVIGGNLGFVHFPGTDTEPGRAGPALAAQLEHIYKEFLLDFDNSYLRQLIHHRREMQKQATAPAPMEANVPQNVPLMSQSLGDITDPNVLSTLVSYSAFSAAELQKRGVAPHIIQIVERNREQLKTTLDSQRNFAKNIQNAREQGSVPQGQQRNVSNSIANAPPTMNAAMVHAQQMNVSNGVPSLGRPHQPLPQQQSGIPSTSTMPPNGHQQQPGPSHTAGPIPGPIGRPTPAQMQTAIETVKRLKEEQKSDPPNHRLINIPDAQRIEYNAAFENLHHMIGDVNATLPHFTLHMKEEVIRKLVVMINVVTQQRELLAGQGPPKYILSLDIVKQMMRQVQNANAMFKNWLASSPSGGAPRPPLGPSGQPGMSSNPPTLQNQQSLGQPQRFPVPATPRPPTAQPQPAPQPPASSPAAPPTHTPSAASPPFVGTPILKKPTPKPTAENPAATPTQTVNSPQTPKSPRNKAVPKPKQPPKPRKVSKIASAPNAASPSAGPSEPKPPAAPATPVNAPTPEGSVGNKRPREEEPLASSVDSTAPPAAKKIKTEWDELPSDAHAKRQAEADAVKTDEDAVKFFEQMSSWLSQVSTEGDGQDSLKTEIADSLDEILKAYPAITDDSGLSSFGGSSFFDNITVGSSSPKLNASMVDPADFFDFTSYGLPEEEIGSKAATPDLVPPSSSVGPSPGSASETEAHHPAYTAADTAKIVDSKAEASDDAIPQDLWRAFDGGESGFYNASDNWKWDQPMPAVNQPWAFFPSS